MPHDDYANNDSEPVTSALRGAGGAQVTNDDRDWPKGKTYACALPLDILLGRGLWYS